MAAAVGFSGVLRLRPDVDAVVDVVIWLALAWWGVGIVAMSWLFWSGGNPLLWRDLLAIAAWGWLGPLIAVGVIFAIIVQLDFWMQPVFPQRKKKP